MAKKSKYEVTRYYDIISAVAQKNELPQSLVRKIFNGIFTEITDSLNAGTSVAIPGFALFELVDVDARKARNPRTGEPIDVPAKTVVKIRRRKRLNEVPEHLA